MYKYFNIMMMKSAFGKLANPNVDVLNMKIHQYS